MHKTTTITPPVLELIGPPHCDSRVLHAPGECGVCDTYPLWQQLRFAWGIAFTGYEPDGKELPDPATYARGVVSINAWDGNRAVPLEDKPNPHQCWCGVLFVSDPMHDCSHSRTSTSEGNKPSPPCEKELSRDETETIFFSPELLAVIKENTKLSDSTRAKLGMPWNQCGCEW